jgi:site-specific recombinase XerD
MGRKASVRQKNGYWFSEAGGVGRYFGRVDQVTYPEAMSRLWTAIAGGGDRGGLVGNDGNDGTIVKPSANEPINLPRRLTPIQPRNSFALNPAQAPSTPTPHNLSSTMQEITVAESMERFLARLGRHRSDRTQQERRRHLRRFCDAYGSLGTTSITSWHLEMFQDDLAARHALAYVKKHVTSVRAMFNKGAKLGWLPHDFRPFASVEPIRLPAKPLLETDLPTVEEVEALMRHARTFRGMDDLMHVYHATGARTHELIEVRIRAFQPQTRQLLIGSHKRSRTLKEPVARRIALNDMVVSTVSRLCEGRSADAHIFIRPSGRPWNRNILSHRFQAIRERAGVRPTITIYSFRHLWISEMLMAGVDVLLVARMAGTSVAMIERVYGHFRNQSYQEAQARLDRLRGARGL